MTKLIIIRRPSGVGKSTVAKDLMKRTKRPTVLVDLDHYRFSFVNPPNHNHDLEYEMSGSDVLIGLKLDASAFCHFNRLDSIMPLFFLQLHLQLNRQTRITSHRHA
jgi:hypothetical protein